MADADLQTLQAQLTQAQRSLAAHDFLLRALLTHLAVTSPESFEALIGGFIHSKRYQSTGEVGDLTREVAQQLVGMLQDVRGSIARR